MPNRTQHALVGAAIGASLNLLKQCIQSQLEPAREFDWAELAVYTAGGAATGILADVLEPATSPNHRAFYHSVVFGATTLYATHGPHSDEWDPESRALLRTMSYCYLSHLVADSTTPKGISLF